MRKAIVGLACCAALVTVAGCGGPDFTSGMRGGGLDSGLGGGYSGYGAGFGSGSRRQEPAAPHGVYPKAELALDIADIRGNPFDYTENDVIVTIGEPDQTSRRVPAFFDGGATWRVRFTPRMAGRHTVKEVTLNGKPVQPTRMEPREFQVTGSPLPGFVRCDSRNKGRFVFDNGSTYYPIGMNVAWGEVASIIGKAGKAGANWARVWMCHWGGANLDWVMNKKLESGALDLDVARKWDSIIEEAEKSGVYVQVVLQHHGQYSSTVNPNWGENPWNKANGGFLATPGEFFVSPRAIALTRAKYRYILARWGYSPNVMAWELFNEVEWTDAITNKHADEVVAWHKGMAQFLRQHDPNRHLVTTSSNTEIAGLFADMDYVQPHAYRSDALAVTGSWDERKMDKPIFYGEIGPDGARDDGTFLHRALWSSIMSRTGGAAQYWMWDAVDANDWYAKFTPAADFVRQSGILAEMGLRPVAVSVTTQMRGPLVLRPGGGWAASKQTEFTVPPSGVVPAFSALPSYLQGKVHSDMLNTLTLSTTFAEEGSVGLSVTRVAKAGAQIVISVDGAKSAEKTYEPSGGDRAVRETISAKVGPGAHAVRIENVGADWVVMGGIVLDPYAPALGTVGKANDQFGAIWVHNRLRSATSGQLSVAGVKAGEYEVTWYDTGTGKRMSRASVTVPAKGSLSFATPAVAADAAVTFACSGRKTAASANQGGGAPRGTPREEVPNAARRP